MKVRSRVFVSILRVVDGDTFIGVVRCGDCGTYVERRCRIFGMDAPELDREPERARASRRYLEGLVAAPAQVLGVVRRTSPDLYGRLLVDLYVGGLSVSGLMIAAGRAVAYEDRVRRSGPFSPSVAGALGRGGGGCA